MNATWPTGTAHLAGESTEESKEELAKGEGKVLVEEVPQKDGHAMVRPATVDEKQALQIPVNMAEKRTGHSACRHLYQHLYMHARTHACTHMQTHTHRQMNAHRPELPKGVVTSKHGLSPFPTTDTHSNMSSCGEQQNTHVYICTYVCTHTNTQTYIDTPQSAKTHTLRNSKCTCNVSTTGGQPIIGPSPLIMPTSLAPSPMARVVAFLFSFTRLTTFL